MIEIILEIVVKAIVSWTIGTIAKNALKSVWNTLMDFYRDWKGNRILKKRLAQQKRYFEKNDNINKNTTDNISSK